MATPVSSSLSALRRAANILAEAEDLARTSGSGMSYQPDKIERAKVLTEIGRAYAKLAESWK